jgi:hypothetical protein
MRPVPEQPVDARLAWQYENAVATGDYRRWETHVFCSCGSSCLYCAEPTPTPGRLWRLRARLPRTRKDR